MPVPYPIALENVERWYPWYVMKSHAVAGTLWLSSSPGSAVKRTLSFWTLLCGEDNGTQTCTAVMDRRHRFWINDIREGVCIQWSHQEPYGQWVNQPVPTPTPSITIDNTFGVPMIWCQARWRLQLLRRWLLCKSCIFGSFLCFRELWFYSFVVLYWFGHIQLHLKILHSTKVHKYSVRVFNINYKDVTLNLPPYLVKPE